MKKPWRRTREPLDHLDCSAVAKVLQQYLDSEIADTDVPAIVEHLDACRACGLAEATYAHIKAALAQPSPADVDAAVLERLRAFAEGLESDGSSPQGV